MSVGVEGQVCSLGMDRCGGDQAFVGSMASGGTPSQPPLREGYFDYVPFSEFGSSQSQDGSETQDQS
jgi:hypothetical protein